jgi:tripartite-type tricarboxylate transporter receptor subunit TctC
MDLLRRQILHLAAGAAALPALSRIAWAQSYPSRLVTIVVPFAAGAPDSVARILAKQLQSQLGKSVIVENRPAANGTVATEAVAKGPPDGCTLLVTSASIAVNPSIYRKLPYNVLTDLEAVTSICRTEGYFLAVHPSVPAKTVQELIALARDPNNRLATAPRVQGTHFTSPVNSLRRAQGSISLTSRIGVPDLPSLISSADKFRQCS